jgi:hypothetical protein
VFCVTIYDSPITTQVNGSGSQLREWAFKHARRRSWLPLEWINENHHFQ